MLAQVEILQKAVQNEIVGRVGVELRTAIGQSIFRVPRSTRPIRRTVLVASAIAVNQMQIAGYALQVVR